MGLLKLKHDLVTLSTVLNSCASMCDTLVTSTLVSDGVYADRVCRPSKRLEQFINTNKPFITTVKGEIDRGLEVLMKEYSSNLQTLKRKMELAKKNCMELYKRGKVIKELTLLDISWDCLFFGVNGEYGDIIDTKHLREFNTQLRDLANYCRLLARKALDWNSKLRLGR